MKKTEYEKNMEHMLKLLHDEWSRSGKNKSEVFLSKESTEKLAPLIKDATLLLQDLVDSDDVLFKDSMRYSQETFVHYRIARKVKKAYDKNTEGNVVIALDKQELSRFKELALAGVLIIGKEIPDNIGCFFQNERGNDESILTV